MKEENKLIRIFTGEQITISHLKGELEIKGISTLVKDGFASGNAAGFVAGTPSSLDLYIQEDDLEKAEAILKNFNKLD